MVLNDRDLLARHLAEAAKARRREPQARALWQRVERVRAVGISEVIMGSNPTLEGDGTALYISNLLADLPVEVTRLARGITVGSVLEFANKEILSDALSGRQKF